MASCTLHLCVWILTLRMTFSRSLYGVAGVRVLFLSMAESYGIHGWTTLHLSFLPLTDTWVASILSILCIMLLWIWVYMYLIESLFPILWGYQPRNGGLSLLIIFSSRISFICPQLFLASMNPCPTCLSLILKKPILRSLPKLGRMCSPGCKEHGGIFWQISCFLPRVCLWFVWFSRVVDLVFPWLPCLSLDVPSSHFLPATNVVTFSSSAIGFPKVMYYPLFPYTFFPSLVSSLFQST